MCLRVFVYVKNRGFRIISRIFRVINPRLISETNEFAFEYWNFQLNFLTERACWKNGNWIKQRWVSEFIL